MTQGKELSNPHSEPTTSRVANVVSSSPYLKPCNVPLPPHNPNMTYIKQCSLESVEGRPGTTEVVEAANQHSFTTMKRIPYQNKCLQPYRNKMKLALIVTALAVVIVTVPAVYTSVNNKKIDIHNTVIDQKRMIHNINTSSVLTQMTEVPTANSHLAFTGM